MRTMAKKGQEKERKYMLGGNNAIKSKQEEYLKHMYTISSHANSGSM